jgi:protein-tyrosine phosphatase
VRVSGQRVLTNLVSLVRLALKAEGLLKPFPERVRDRFESWVAEREDLGRTFPEPDVLAAEIVDGPQAALEQFVQIAAELKEPMSA